MKDTRSLLLLLLSITLVGTWVYHLYDKTEYSQRRTEVYIKDSTAIADGIRDSLNKLYSDAIKDLDTRLVYSESSTDSLKRNLRTRLNELNKLRNEIRVLLKDGTVTNKDLVLARKKISELKQKVDELKNENTILKEETGKFNELLQQINSEIEILQKDVQRLNNENKSLSEKINLASVFVASDMSLNAITLRKQQEQETLQAKKTEKLVASFLLQNPLYDFTNTEVIAVIIQPDGQVLRNNESEPETFETKSNETLNLTRKIRLDYTKGERRKIIFSMPGDKFQKGKYQLQLWHKGIIIGQTSKSLS